MPNWFCEAATAAGGLIHRVNDATLPELPDGFVIDTSGEAATIDRARRASQPHPINQAFVFPERFEHPLSEPYS